MAIRKTKVYTPQQVAHGDGDAFHAHNAGEFLALTEEASPGSTFTLVGEDGTTGAKRRVAVSSLPAGSERDQFSILLESPYQGTAGLHQWKGAVHNHTTNSDGENSPAALIAMYATAGWHFVATTDHDYVTAAVSSPACLHIVGFEQAFWDGADIFLGTIDSTHQEFRDSGHANFLARSNSDFTAGSKSYHGTATAVTSSTIEDTAQAWTVNQWAGKKVRTHPGGSSGRVATITSNTSTTLTIDTDLTGTVSVGDVFYIENRCIESPEYLATSFRTLNHDSLGGGPLSYPVYGLDTDELYRHLGQYHAMEVYNGYQDTTGGTTAWSCDNSKYDYLLGKGARLWCTAVDDYHTTVTNTALRGFVMVFTDDATTPTQSKVIDALIAGKYYSSTGPTLASVSISSTTITIVADQSCACDWIGCDATGAAGSVLQSDSPATSHSYTVVGTERYVRAVLTRSSDSTLCWTNPVFVTQGNAGERVEVAGITDQGAAGMGRDQDAIHVDTAGAEISRLPASAVSLLDDGHLLVESTAQGNQKFAIKIQDLLDKIKRLTFDQSSLGKWTMELDPATNQLSITNTNGGSLSIVTDSTGTVDINTKATVTRSFGTGSGVDRVITVEGDMAQTSAGTGRVTALSTTAKKTDGYDNTRTSAALIGHQCQTSLAGAGNVKRTICLNGVSYIEHAGASADESFGGYFQTVSFLAAGTVTHGVGVYVAHASGAGALSLQTGLYLEDMTTFGAGYAIFSSGGNVSLSGDMDLGLGGLYFGLASLTYASGYVTIDYPTKVKGGLVIVKAASSYQGIFQWAASLSKTIDITSAYATAVTWNADVLAELSGVTATAAEVNILDGATLSTAELNLLDGVTGTTTAELTALHGWINRLPYSVGGSRALGTAYHNTNAYPIVVNPTATSDAAASLRIQMSDTEGGTYTTYCRGTAAAAATQLAVYGEIPPGKWYKVSVSAGTGTLTAWMEAY